jgi:hypothetical protein
MTAELLLTVAIAGFATLIAAGMVTVPVEFTSSFLVQGILLIAALSMFAYSPVVGIATMALFAVLIFNRNLQKTMAYSSQVPQYGDETIYKQYVKAQPYMSMSSEPNPYPPASRQMWGVEGFEASPFGGAEVAVDGQYPLPAPSMASGYSSEFSYTPAADTGSNVYEPSNSTVDEKVQVLSY